MAGMLLKIARIKAFRREAGLSLKASKLIVEAGADTDELAEAIRTWGDSLMANKRADRDMLAALELIANGREVLLDDGSTVVVDLDDPAAVARAAIAQAKGGSIG